MLFDMFDKAKRQFWDSVCLFTRNTCYFSTRKTTGAILG